MNPRDIILEYSLTEKATDQASFNKYTFIVNKTANRTKVRNAVEQHFNDVEVGKVNILVRKGKGKSNRMRGMRGGGVAFGPKPRDYSQQINQKTRRLALQRALYEQANNGAIDLIEDWVVAEPKTRIVSGILSKVAPEGKVLMLGDEFSRDALLACRNIPRLSVTRSSDVNALDLVHHDRIIISEKGLEQILKRAK